jgi:4-amino-4-deoxy-L-arabinose transferase-like glycosyltransferase
MVSKDDQSAGGGGRSPIDLLGQPETGTDHVIDPVPGAAPARGRLAVPGRADESPLPTLFLVLVGVITVGGLLLRLPSFNDSPFGDEISTYFIVVGHNLGRTLRLVESNQETSPPLYFILAWATKGLLGSPVQSIRLVSLVTGTAAIPLTFLLGLWTVGRRAALVGATCVALSPYMIFYSSEARPFMLLLFLTLLSTLALLRALDTGRPGWWVAYAVCSCGAVYTHYTAVFLLVVQLGWALWTHPKARRALVVANVAAGLGFIPWLNGFREDLHAPSFISALAPANLHIFRIILETSWIGHPETTIGRLPGESTVALAGAGLAVAVLGLALKATKSGRLPWRLPPRTALVVLLAIAPAVLVLIYSVTRADIFGGPFLIASWPGLALAIGALVTSPPRPLRVAAIVLTLGAFAIGGFKMVGTAAQRPNIDSPVAYIDRVGANGDPIVSLSFFANPLSEVDVALADAGQSQHHAILRLGSPTLAEQLAPLTGPNPQPVFFGLPVIPPQEVARQAVALARHGTIFFVSYVTSLLPNEAPIETREFLKALPARFHVVRHLTYPGYSGGFVQSLYVIRDMGPERIRSR